MSGAENRSNFVAPYADGNRRGSFPLSEAVDPIQITRSEMPAAVVDPTRDAISSADRARALRIRAHPIWWLVFSGSCAATFAYTIAADAAGFSAAFNLDKFLVFAAVLTISGMLTYLRLNRLDFDHSRAGVERYRLKTYADIRKAELEAELEIRRAALDASVKLLEGDHVRQNRD